METRIKIMHKQGRVSDPRLKDKEADPVHWAVQCTY